MRHALTVGLLFLAAHLCAVEAEKPDDLTRAKSLVQQLDSNDFEAREKASAEIARLGSRCKAELLAALDKADPELRQRITKALLVIRRQESEPLWKEALKKWPQCLNDGKLAGPIFGALETTPVVQKEVDMGTHQHPEQGIDGALEWMAINQCGDGHWDAIDHGAQASDDLSTTALALLSFLGAGHSEKVGRYKDNVRAAVGWLLQRQREDGALVNQDWSDVDGLSHAVAGWALSESAGMARIPATKIAAQKALDYSLSQHQVRSDGKTSGFSRAAGSADCDLLTTMFFLLQIRNSAVAELRVPKEGCRGIARFVESLFVEKESGFRMVRNGKVSVDATIIGCFSSLLLNGNKDRFEPIIARFMLEYRPSAEPSSNPILNFAGDWACYLCGGENWKKWNEEMKTKLLSGTTRDGQAAGSWPAFGALSHAGRVVSTALTERCFEVYYAYQPRGFIPDKSELEPDK